MTRRIFRGISLTVLAAVLLTSVFITLTLYTEYEKQMDDELRTETEFILHGLLYTEDEEEYFVNFSSHNRITLVAPDGVVIYDSTVDAEKLENHASRPEIAEALKNGSGESRRYSSTFAETTLYYAAKTARGNVLRISNTKSSLLGLLSRMLSAIILIIAGIAALSIVAAQYISKKIVAPINALNIDEPLENDIYDELSPLLLRMHRQKKEIIERISEIEQKQNELSAITENMREGLIVLDKNNIILSMNESAAKIFDTDTEKRVGGDILEISREEAVQSAVAASKNGSGTEALLEKEARRYRLIASPVIQQERILGTVLLIQDITDKYEAELSRREFTANVSHELKTPLTSISGYAEIMRDGVAKADDMQNFAARIYDETNRLIALVNDILELSKLDEADDECAAMRGKQKLSEKSGHSEDIELHGLALKVAERLSPNAAAKDIKLTVLGEIAAVRGFRSLLYEMLFNLVDNAIKYTEKGGKVSITTRCDSEHVFVSVEDTGIGIAPEHHAHIFERFYRVDKSHSKKTGGTGLGLSIVKHGAKVHGAEIKLVSEPGKGTRISLIFPVSEIEYN